ncbi:uncharacterized protein LOC120066990 [Benincasa hispida]|uniref:uncharacterized protein LOC120066990 n=1 Tax=Benincasa hispida TaxID=102211 RepID=UPI0019012E03|nr:uncharacterized protein LOC120066990 [Benincasa hispida]
MATSLLVIVIIASLHLIAFVFAIGAEMRRSTATVVPDEYDETTYCVYDSDASTTYGLVAFGLLLISHTVLMVVTRCLCCGKGLKSGGSTVCAIILFVVSWHLFLGAESLLLAGSVRNAYHTKFRSALSLKNLSCAMLRRGVFAAAAALTFLSLVFSILYYTTHARADTGGWQKHQNEGVGMVPSNLPRQEQHDRRAEEFEKV